MKPKLFTSPPTTLLLLLMVACGRRILCAEVGRKLSKLSHEADASV
jgi:hypothetical protein